MRKCAETVKEGIDAVEGMEGIIYQVAETLPAEVLEKMHAPPKADYPIIDPHTLDTADGFVFGFPTRFGMMCAQMKAFFDATGSHWQKQSLSGKPAGLFTGTATQVGGMETTLLSAVTILAHHGMIYVPVGCAAPAAQFGMSEPRGGGPLGAGVLAGGDGSRQASADELAIAKAQGTKLAQVAKKLSA